MNADTEDRAAASATGLLILASPDGDWWGRVEAALAGRETGPALVPRRLDDFGQMDRFLQQPARLWLVDEAWAGPVLARRRLATAARLPSPDVIVRFEELTSADVAAMIHAGARGCLPSEAGVDETLLAFRAVLGGELWLSRRVFAQVLAHIHRQANGHAAGDGQDRLTGRQRQIAACVARGLSNKQIGRQLEISPTTVKTHLHNIFERLGVGGRTLLALRAADDGSDDRH